MSIPRSAASLFAALCLCSAPGCNRSGDALDEGQGALTGEGFKLLSLHSVPPAPFSAKACRQSVIESLDAVMCSYASADARARGEKAIEGWVASAVTGTWVPRDLPEGRATGGARYLLLGLADRTHADLSGKTIQKLSKAFRQK